jgi:hypothetical protein
MIFDHYSDFMYLFQHSTVLEERTPTLKETRQNAKI